MQALTQLSDRVLIPSFQALPEKVQTLSKAALLAIPVIVVAAATYAAPVTLVLGSLGICILSAKAVEKALSGTIADQENAIRMIVAAILITSITLGGLTIGLTPACLSLIATAFKASSFGAIISQFTAGCLWLTSLWGYGGGLTLEALNNANDLTLDKFQHYFNDLKNRVCTRSPKEMMFSEFLFFAFRGLCGNILINQPSDKLPSSIFYLATKKEIEVVINNIIREIQKNASLYADTNGIEDNQQIVFNIEDQLKLLSRLVARLPESEQIENIASIFESLTVLNAYQDLRELSEQFFAPYKWIFNLKLQSLLSQDPAKLIVEIDKEITAMETKNNSTLSFERIFNLKNRTLQLKNNLLAIRRLFPNLNDIKNWNEEISYSLPDKPNKLRLLERLDHLHAACQKQNKVSAKQDVFEETVWNLLITYAGYKGKIDPLITKLKLLLRITEDAEIDSKMEAIGLGTVKDLIDKGIVTEEELKDYDLVQQRVLGHIQEIMQALLIKEVSLTAIFRFAVVFSLLAPLACSPGLALAGGMLGVVGFGLSAIEQNKAQSFDEMWKWLVEKPERSFLSFLMKHLARRTVGGIDQSSQSDLRQFIGTSYLDKMRQLSKEFSYAAIYIALTKVKVIALLIIPVLGAMLGREAVEQLYPLASPLLKQKKNNNNS